MTDYGCTPVIRLPKSKVDIYSDQANDYLVSDTLYLNSFPSTVGEAELRHLLQKYQPLEIRLYRHNGEGYLRFSDVSVADQVYALYQDFQFDNGTKLHFSVYPDGHHEAESMLLKVACLPRYVENGMVYQLFRPFGPLALCKLLLEQDESHFLGTALIQYFYHEDSEAAIQAMHGQVLDGSKIVVESFIPSDHYQKSPPSSSSMNPDNSPESNYVDVMNLYIKNLDPKVTNTELFNAFRAFGRIVSARVMTNPANNQSKGYGFVSYGRSDEARMALEQMNGKLFYQKPLVVSYHAPKKPRQAPPASPPQEYSSPYQEFRQQHQQHQHDITPANNSTINGLGIDNVDQIAMDIKDLSIGQHYPSVPPYPIQRKLSVADNYMSVRMSPPFSSSPISGSTGHSLASLASGLSVQQPPTQHQHYQHQHQNQHSTPTLTSVPGLSKSSSPPPQLSGDSNGRLPSDYKHTSDGRPTLRRKSSLESISTVMTESSANLQRHKLTQAVLQCDVPFDNQNLVSDIVDMLLTLKKKERSLCLFNQDFIKTKIQLALEALEIFHDGEDSDEDDEEEKALQKMLPRQPMKKKSSPLRSTPTAASQTTTTAISLTTMDEQHSTKLSQSTNVPKCIPARASKAIPIVAPPAIVSTVTATSLPANSDISNSNKKIAKTTASSSNGSISENKTVIDSLIKSMENKPIHEKKQLLGDRLFPLVKATGTKQAPKVTIAMLDSVDLLALASMMFDKGALKKQVDVTFTALKQQQ